MATIEIRNDFPGMNGKLTRVYLGDLVLWFSYETIVAFHAPGERITVSENSWGTTTAKHLNYIDSDKSIRTPRVEFTAKLDALQSRVAAAFASIKLAS